jgi:mRNA-degrading endonuclease RelE of RelBE toxin-antitoxin system
VKWKIVWALSVWEVFKELAEPERKEILERLEYLKRFPHMYPLRTSGSRFRRHRWFLARDWLLYYRVTRDTVYIRGLWPARIP